MRIRNLDLRQGRAIQHRSRKGHLILESRLAGRPIPEGREGQEPADVALFGRAEGVEDVCVALDRVPSLADTVIEDDEGAAAAGERVDRDGYGGEEVAGAVGAGGGGGTHCADDDDGRGAGEGYVEAECLEDG